MQKYMVTGKTAKMGKVQHIIHALDPDRAKARFRRAHPRMAGPQITVRYLGPSNIKTKMKGPNT